MIIINVSSVKKGRSGGSETLATNFIRCVEKIDIDVLYIGAFDYLKSLNVSDKKSLKIYIKNHIIRRIIVEYFCIPFYVLLVKPEKVINFSNTASPIICKNLNLVIILDANYRYHKEMKKWKRTMLRLYTILIARRADKIVTISKSAARDLRREIKGNIHVAYLGGSFSLSMNESDSTLTHLHEPYALALGSLSTNKNIEWLVSNWDASLPKLVVAGHGSEVFTRDNSVGIGYVSSYDLRKLFLKCSVFIFPSKYEGFGIPIVDCMNMKKPLVLSDIEVFREIAGSYGSFFTLGSKDSLVDAVFLELSKKDSRQVPRDYSWENFAKSVLDLAN